jgi:HEAT repeat protein/CRP-like cAMP-binding protein
MAAEASRGAGGEAAIAAFLAQVNAYMSLAGFVVQVALTSVIHRSLGLTFALLLLPVSFAATGTIVLISGALWAPAVARGLDTTLRYTVDKTTRELLFLPLPAELKYRAKPFIDVTMDRFARAVAAVVVLVLIKPWGFGLDWRRLSYASITITTLWIVVALVARRDYLASFRSSIGARSIRPEAIRTDVGDAATIEALVEELSSEDEDAVLYAIDVLEALEKPNLITPLLLHHDAPRVRARVLRAFSPTQSRGVARWQTAVERLVHDEDVDVRAAALRALAVLAHEDLAAVMRRHLDDPEPRVAVAAAAILADTAHEPDVLLAEAALGRLEADTRAGSVAGRKETASALAHIRSPRFRPLLVPLLDDHDVGVVREAIGSARRMGMSDGLFLPSLMTLLGHRLLKSEARAALVGYGEEVIDALGHALRDPREQIWVRRHIPATLALLPTRASMDVLVAALADSDGFVRFKAIAAIESLQRDHPGLTCPRQTIEQLTVQETSRYYAFLTLRYNLMPLESAGRGSLLDRALDDKLARTVDRVYRLLGLLYGIDDVAVARFAIEQAEPRRRAAAIEFLDNTLSGALRKRVLPLLESAPLPDRVRHANHVLKSRPRDVEDTLAQLVHDDDPVVAASAIHFVAGHALWALEDDLQFVLRRRAPEDRTVVEAARWAIERRHRVGGSAGTGSGSLPVVELADRLRAVVAFQFVSVEDLFRLAEMGEEARHPPNHQLHHPGATLDGVEILIEGAARIGVADSGAAEMHAPCAIGVEEVLQSAPARFGVWSVGHAVTVRIRASDFMTMVSDNVLLAQGLFSMLLAPSAPGASRPADALLAVTPWRARSGPLQPVDQALLLRQHPLLGRATAAQLLELVGAARAVSLDRGRTLFSGDEPASLFLVLDGRVRMEREGFARLEAGAGATLGVAETLAGLPSGWRATVTEAGRALRLERQALFTVLTDHVELMQGLFSGVLSLRT